MNRRRFVKSVAGAALALQIGPTRVLAQSGKAPDSPGVAPDGVAKVANKLRPCEYQGVRLLPGPLADRLGAAREYLFNVPDDDLLKGYREAAGLPAPGRHLGGWCEHNSAMVFGQWLSAMARLSRATHDAPLLEKAVRLMRGWGDLLDHQRWDHYIHEKFVVGLVDLYQYGDVADALPYLARLTEQGEKNLGRKRVNPSDQDTQGMRYTGENEWYVLPENYYRAYLLTGEVRYRDFADMWRYPHYWGYFNGQTPGTPDGVHAYSHCNALNGAVMAYAVTGQAEYLRTITNGYEYFQKTQCYATGGYGPGEKLMPPDGSLGRSIEAHEPNASNLGGTPGRSFETPCGTWAVCKLTRSLQAFTGEARYGDWAERVLYNGIGAALPIRGQGQSFYYADYRLLGARKAYFPAAYPCCAGTYFQDLAGLHDVLYYTSPAGLYVNLYVPSEATWKQDGQIVTLTQRTTYPESDVVSLSVASEQPQAFTVGLRIPEWAGGAGATINGRSVTLPVVPGTWLELHRPWQPGDRIDLRLPLAAREVPIDEQHPKRVAYAQGPVVMVLPEGVSKSTFTDPPTGGMVPFSSVGEGRKYAIYFDV